MMCSFTVINSAPACQSPQIMGWLRKSLGFDGMVRSDRPTTVTNLVKAVDQGMDQSFEFTPEQVLAAVNDGLLAPEQVATAAYHIVLPAFEFGIMDRPWTNTSNADVSTPRNKAVALRVAQQGTVLLRNEGRTLPLRGPRLRSIAVIGSDASTDPVTGPNYSAFGFKLPPSPNLVTPLTAITERAHSEGIPVTYAEGDHTGDPTKDADEIAAAAAAASRASVAIVFVGLNAGEGADLSSATLAGDGDRSDRDQLIEAVAAANPNTIVVLNTANPVLMPWNNKVAGIVQAWYPGQVSGPAISSILFGDVNPSGKLPVTIPTQASQSLSADPARYPGVNGTEEYSEGLNIGYKWYNANNFTPLYPFGYGLSYTTFSFSKIHVTHSTLHSRRIDPNGSPDDVVATVRATVTNTGDRTGKEIAQLYLTDPAAANEPERQLRGVQPVTLEPHQRATVTFDLTASDLAYYSDADSSWHVAPGPYGVSVGDSSAIASLPLRDTLTVR
jgi:beta-glucosidase